MKWYEVKEQAAGQKRLKLLWYIYNCFGKGAVKFIVFWVTLISFILAKPIRNCSLKYLGIIGKKSLLNSFRHFLSFSYSLIDKMEYFTDNYDIDNINFADESSRQMLFKDLLNRKGIFFLCSHLGNIDVMRTFFKSGVEIDDIKVNLFLETRQCQIFRSFINEIAEDNPIQTYPVEDINLSTSIELKDKLDNGEIVFMAGDRTAPDNADSVFIESFLGRDASFPLGAFKFALLMGAPIYFIVCTKEKNDKTLIHLKKFLHEGKRTEKLKALEKEYVSFLEDLTFRYPFQFYNFYDFFND